MNGKIVQGKYELFLQKYNEGVRKYIPIYREEYMSLVQWQIYRS
ncbi:hypothetical protein E2C01_082102 [Portunus trituberculatus]|uniref:Uncharacterized protein n=1 Tax=Portunus trituberculatus TaxID=210409 RepID=A0A5B7IXJ8_PORTR|nr:hypothetical protein [Portunus trituberculatus]